MSDAFNKTDSFTLPAFLINVDARQPNPPPMPTPLLGEENSRKMKALVVQKIKKAAFEHRIEKSEHFLWLLNRWRIWGGAEEVVNWVKAFVKDSESALEITMASVSIGSIHGNRQTRIFDSLNLGLLEGFIDLDTLWNYLANLDKSELSDREKHILNLFQKGLENKRNGKPYHSISDEEW
jgi:hypothetical protein